MNKWIEILYFDGVEIQTFYGVVSDLEKDVLSKQPNEWVLVHKPRFLNEDATRMEIFEEDLAGTESYFYLRSKNIVRVAPIREDVTFWEEGKIPS